MDLLPSLCAAMVRAGGDSLVLCEGAPPHVMSGTNRQDVARAVLSHNAVEALLIQIFSEPSRRALLETGRVSELVRVAEPALVVTATATQQGDRLCIELVRQQAEPVETPAPAEPDLSLVPADVEDSVPAVEPVPRPEDLALSPTDLGLVEPVVAAPDIDEPPVVEPQAPATWSPEPPVGRSAIAREEPASVPAPTERAESVAADVVTPVVHPIVHAPANAAVRAYEPAPEGTRLAQIGSPTDLQTDLLSWINKAAALGATAVYLRASAPVVARVDGKLTRVDAGLLSASVFASARTGLESATDPTWHVIAAESWTRDSGTLGRMTCRAFTDDLGPGMVVFLETPGPAPSFHRFIPRKVKGSCDGDGLVVVSASTPADVLTLGAATADWAGQRRGGYVIALRPAGAPQPQLSGDFVSLRELPVDEAQIASAIRAAAAESPDVLLVASPPSETAMREVVHAADGGRLVIVALLAQTSIQALRALVGRSQSGGDAPNRLALATAFRAAFSHRVLRRLRGGQTLIQDLILGTSDASTLLASGDLMGLVRLQRAGVAGMSTVDVALARAVTRGHLSLRQAAAQTADRGHLIALVRTTRRARTNRAPQANDSVVASVADGVLTSAGAGASWGGQHTFVR